MPVRLQDIADDLNLSKMTISKVLRGQTDVSAETKARVLQRMKELNYRPNITARSLRTGHTFSIGLVIPSLLNPFFAEVARGIVQVIRPAGYGLFISSAEDDAELEKQEIELQLSRRVDALIVASLQTDGDFFKEIDPRNVPLILIDRKFNGVDANFVGTRDEEIGYLAAEHLIKGGYKKIAYIRGPQNDAGNSRFAGYRKAFEQHRMKLRPELIVEIESPERQGEAAGYAAICRLLRGATRPDAVICYDDLIAAGVMEGISENNLKIPNDIAVVGCGNMPWLRWMKVPLSSIDQSAIQLGQKAAKLALKLISMDQKERASSKRSILLSPKVIVRQSSQRLK